MLSYVHPFVAVIVLALLAHVASLGVRSRSDRRNAGRYLRRHAKLAPWMYAGVLLTWSAGLASTWLLRPANELAASGHFRIGTALVLLLSAGALSSRWMNRPAVRAAHPWFGAL